MKDKDPDHIAAVEKAIAEKYGEATIANPNATWSETKERVYLKQMKELYQKTKKNEEWQEKVDINGIKVSKKLFNRDSTKCCPVCGSFARKAKDDVYLIKFDCCEMCFERYVDGREKRWIDGWRPTKEENK